MKPMPLQSSSLTDQNPRPGLSAGGPADPKMCAARANSRAVSVSSALQNSPRQHFRISDPPVAGGKRLIFCAWSWWINWSESLHW